MYLYNSLSLKKEEFVPNEPGKVKMYTCGPTVYHLPTLGICVPTLWKMCWKNTCAMRGMMCCGS